MNSDFYVLLDSISGFVLNLTSFEKQKFNNDHKLTDCLEIIYKI